MSMIRRVIQVLIWLPVLSTVNTFAQSYSYPETVEQAIAWRQNQNAAHVILWNNYHYELNEDSFSALPMINLVSVTNINAFDHYQHSRMT